MIDNPNRKRTTIKPIITVVVICVILVAAYVPTRDYFESKLYLTKNEIFSIFVDVGSESCLSGSSNFYVTYQIPPNNEVSRLVWIDGYIVKKNACSVKKLNFIFPSLHGGEYKITSEKGQLNCTESKIGSKQILVSCTAPPKKEFEYNAIFNWKDNEYYDMLRITTPRVGSTTIQINYPTNIWNGYSCDSGRCFQIRECNPQEELGPYRRNSWLIKEYREITNKTPCFIQTSLKRKKWKHASLILDGLLTGIISALFYDLLQSRVKSKD